MDVELLEIRDFLAAHHPFDQLPDETLSALPARLEIRYLRRGTEVAKTDALHPTLNVIRAGAVEIQESTGDLLARLGEGDIFGHRVTSRDGTAGEQVKFIEDTLLYLLPAAEVDRLCKQCKQFAFFFGPEQSSRLRDAVANLGEAEDTHLNLMTTSIRELVSRGPIEAPPTAPIHEVAKTMGTEGVSSMLITEGDKLIGIVTDRDLRKRVLAAGVSPDRPIGEVMTPNPATVDANTFGFQALLMMARNNIHHLPVVDAGKVAGMITATTLTERHSTSAVYLVGSIYKQASVEGLKELSAKVPDVLTHLVAADASANSTAHIVTAVGDAITVRLLQLAEEELGPPPVPYTWVALGSQARNEQTAHSDQDNCLILDDSYDAGRHGEYFSTLARRVCDGLDACGYVYCPGEMMAMTDQWRLPLSTWKANFDRWIEEPEPKALMLTCVFFDFRPIYGEMDLFATLRERVLEKTRNNRIFLAYMASNALSHRPPLGFFRKFVLIHGGEHDHTFDLKHNGVIPIVDLARVYALAGGIEAVNTQDRLAASIDGGEVSGEGAMDLRDAFEFINSVRLRHQARLIQAGQSANNFMSPDALSPFERNHLKDAFSVVRTMQGTLAQRFQVSQLT